MNKRIISIICICILLVGTTCFTGCIPRANQQAKEETKEKEEADKEDDEDDKKDSDDKDSKKDEDDEKEEDDKVIVAGSVDTSSKFSFAVEEALIGLSYSDMPIVVLVGTFENNSDEIISFSWALDVSAMQAGYTLPTAYLSGSSTFNYNEIEPGKSITVYLGWEIADAESDITLTVIDSQHYAKEEIYSQKFTIEELVENTKNFADSDDVIEQPL